MRSLRSVDVESVRKKLPYPAGGTAGAAHDPKSGGPRLFRARDLFRSITVPERAFRDGGMKVAAVRSAFEAIALERVGSGGMLSMRDVLQLLTESGLLYELRRRGVAVTDFVRGAFKTVTLPEGVMVCLNATVAAGTHANAAAGVAGAAVKGAMAARDSPRAPAEGVVGTAEALRLSGTHVRVPHTRDGASGEKNRGSNGSGSPPAAAPSEPAAPSAALAGAPIAAPGPPPRVTAGRLNMKDVVAGVWRSQSVEIVGETLAWAPTTEELATRRQAGVSIALHTLTRAGSRFTLHPKAPALGQPLVFEAPSRTAAVAWVEAIKAAMPVHSECASRAQAPTRGCPVATWPVEACVQCFACLGVGGMRVPRCAHCNWRCLRAWRRRSCDGVDRFAAHGGHRCRRSCGHSTCGTCGRVRGRACERQ